MITQHGQGLNLIVQAMHGLLTQSIASTSLSPGMQGSRILLVAFSVGHLSGLFPDEREFLLSLCFKVPGSDVQHGPTMLPYPLHGHDLRCPQTSTDSAPLASQTPAFPHAELPADGPLVIELCAGSAILSQTAAARGFFSRAGRS